jgi:hypothetical protein
MELEVVLEPVNTKMETFTMALGKLTEDLDKVSKSTRMVPSTKETGKMIAKMGTEYLLFMMEVTMMENG